MNILQIDTTGAYASCAIMRDGVVVAERVQASGLVHSKSVMLLVDGCLESVGMDISETDVFSCVAGPGSFTGVRIGVCAVKGMAQALNKPCYGVNTLECLSKNLVTESCICPMLDARRGQVYTAVYQAGNRIFDFDACPVEAVLEFVKNKKTVFIGDGATAFKEKIINYMGENASFAPSQHNYVRAASALEITLKAAEEGKLVAAAALDAIYLRKPQAEREYERNM